MTPPVRADDAHRVRAWLFDRALPLWSTVGMAPAGGFVERLTADGRAAGDAYTRLRVQARQTYVYSHAAVLGWNGPALAAAGAGFDFLTRRCWLADGGFAHRVTPAGTPLDAVRDMYDHAFVLLALAWFRRAGGAAALPWIGRTLDYVDRTLADPVHGGYRESVPPALPRRQNPHMHLLEALLALHAATGDGRFLDRARDVVALFRRRFFDGRVLREFFAEDWRPAPGVAGRTVEPGHHFEWVWLLHRHARATGDDVTAEAEALYAFACEHGVDAADGLVFDAVLDDGTPLRDSKRCWPQTEALKAHLSMAETGGRDTAAAIARTIDGLFAHYLAAGDGWWQDHIARDHAPLSRHAPASTLYHLFVGFAEALRLAAPAAADGAADGAAGAGNGPAGRATTPGP